MAIYTINIEDSNEFDSGPLNPNIYFGTSNTFPTNETDLKNGDFQKIEKEFLDLSFDSGKNHFIGLPKNIGISEIINIDNLHENITTLFIFDSTNIPVNVDGATVNYNLYKLEMDREYSDAFNLIVKINTP